MTKERYQEPEMDRKSQDQIDSILRNLKITPRKN